MSMILWGMQMNFKEIRRKFFQMMQESYQRFRVAIVLDAVLFLCVALLTYWQNYHIHNWYTEQIGCAAAASAVSLVFAVSLRLFRERYGQAEGIFQREVLPSAAVFLLFFFLVQGHEFTDERIWLQTVGAALFFASVGFYCLESSKDGERAFLTALFAAFEAGIVGSLFSVSLSICLLAFSSLIVSLETVLEGTLYSVIVEFAFFFAGLQVFLASLPVVGRGAEAPSLFRSLLVRLLWPVYLILLLILYLYVAKIIYIWEMPVGMMNWFASLAILVFAFYFFSFAGDGRHSLLQRFLRWGFLLFLPILIVQAIGMWQRIEPYGLTSPRYASILCTLFGIGLLLLASLRRLPHAAFLVFGAMALIFSLTPLNILDFPLRTQEARFWSIIEANHMVQDGVAAENVSLSEMERVKLLSAMEYMMERGQTEFLEQPGMRDMLAALVKEARKPEKVEYKDWARFESPNPSYIPVAGWSKAYTFDHRLVENGAIVIELGNGTEETYSVAAFLEELKEYNRLQRGKGESVFVRELRLDVDENTCLYFSVVELFIQRKLSREEITVHMSGVLLKR